MSIMAANVLSATEKLAVVEWIAEGLTDAEVVEKLQAEFGKTVTVQNINGYYRKPHAAEIEAARTARFETACATGFGNRANRVNALKRAATKLCKHVDDYDPGLWYREGFNVVKELRDTFAAIAKECGQEASTRLSHEFPDGIPPWSGVPMGLTEEEAEQYVKLCDVAADRRATDAVGSSEAAD